MKIFLIINGHLLVVPIVFISFRLLFLTGRKGYGKKIMSASGPALLLPDLHYRFRTCINDNFEFSGGGWVVGGGCAKSFLCLTQLKVMLG